MQYNINSFSRACLGMMMLLNQRQGSADVTPCKQAHGAANKKQTKSGHAFGTDSVDPDNILGLLKLYQGLL